MTLEEELRRADQAQRLLEDPLFKAAREDVIQQMKGARLSASPADTNLHSKLILMEQVADRFFGYFEQIAQTGKFASLELQQQENRQRGLMDRLQSYLSWGRNGL